jgi:hypothetical protein
MKKTEVIMIRTKKSFKDRLKKLAHKKELDMSKTIEFCLEKEMTKNNI